MAVDADDPSLPSGPVLDIGAGTGRVSLDLARAGHDVIALDLDGDLLEALRARGAGLPVRTVAADACDFAVDELCRLVLVPMQTVQLLGGKHAAMLRCIRDALAPGGLVAIAIADPPAYDGEIHPLPDMTERGGWVWCSQPVAIRARPDGMAIERVRELVAPDGERTVTEDVIVLARVSATDLEQAGFAAGLEPAGTPPDTRQPTTTSAARWSFVADAVPARLRALPRPHEHLRRPRQPAGLRALFERRCEWRGIRFELTGSGLGEPLDPAGHDLFYIGGGQDRDQRLCAYDMVRTKREALHAAARRGAPILAVCGGYQLLGHSYALADEEIPGVGLVDLRTVRSDGPRLTGNVAIEVELPGLDRPHVLAGFENHAGRTHLGAAERPLGRVLRGHGNTGDSGFEGVLHGSVVGTYLHGPLLPKNTWFADWLIQSALGLSELEPLGDAFEDGAHASARRAAGLTP